MAPGLPTGTPTFVFTDIEGSTRLLRDLHDDYATVLSDHHAILDDCLGAEGGVRLSDEGDGSFFVFGSAASAIRAALDAQDAMAARPWPGGVEVRVRIGMHTGEAKLTGEGRYVGLSVHLAARVAALAHGGQTVVSEASHAVAAPVLDGIGFLDLGRHRLAGFPDPVVVLQPYRGVPHRFPPLRSLLDVDLPATVGTLFGREREVSLLASLLGSHRLVTILGPGGTGKTRLGIEVGRALLGDGVPCHFVDLTAIQSSDLLPSLTGSVLGISEDPGVDPLSRIASAVGRAQGVLLLDNCEHLLPGVSAFARRLLEADERARMLTTSRSPLGLPGERIFDLGPLDLAGQGASPSPAVSLFAERAAAVAPEFRLDGTTLPAVVEIAGRLDGMPLALELAASMSRLLPVAELARMLGERMDFLEGGSGVPDRHRSLAAVLEGSVAALDPSVRDAFEWAGAMNGPFRVDDLAAVAGLDAYRAVAAAASLVDHSLLRREVHPTGPLLSMLETIRWFAREELERSGRQEEAKRRHLDRFCEHARGARTGLRTPSGPSVLDRLWIVRPNLLFALDHALESGDGANAMTVVEGLVDAWSVRSAAREAGVTIDRVAGCISVDDPETRLRALLAKLEIRQAHGVGVHPDPAVAGEALRLARGLGDSAAGLRASVWVAAAGLRPVESALQDLVALERGDDHRAAVFATEAIGWMLWWLGRMSEATRLFGRLYDRARESGDPIALLDASLGIISTAPHVSQMEDVQDIADAGSELAESLGAGWWEGVHLQWMAEHSRRLGHLEESSEWLNRAYRSAVESGTDDQVAFATANQATLAYDLGDLATAYGKTIEFAETFGHHDRFNPFVPEMAAAVAVRWGRFAVAAQLLGAAEAWRKPGGLTSEGMPMPEWDEPRHRAVVAELRTVLGPTADLLWSEGAGMPPDEVMRLVHGLAGR